MQSEYIFGAESTGSLFDHHHVQTATQVAAAPQAGEALETPLLPHDAAQVVITPGQSVVRIPVTPGEVVELPFGPDAHFVARLGDGNLAIKVGDVTVILQGYQAGGDNPPVLHAADGTPIDIATILAETDPNIDIKTAAGPGDNGGQGADNTGALFQQLGGGDGLAGFQGAGGQDDTSGPDGGPGADGGPLLRTLADAGPVNLAPSVSDFGATTDEDTALKGQLTGTDPNGDPLTFQTTGTVPKGLTVNADGTWSFDPTGAYDYLAAGDHTTVTFQYKANDGSLDSNVGTVTLTIDGLNDLASIAGDNTGKVKEDVTATATGQVTVSDLDHDEAHTTAQADVPSTYGKWSVDSDGNWTYGLDNSNAAVNALPEGGKLTDSFTITSLDGTASETVTITINGTNDKPTITGQFTGDVTEDLDLLDTGKVTISDPDTGENGAKPELNLASHGGWGVGPDGSWFYLVNQLDPAVQALHTGETLTDTFTITSKDGSAAQQVTITIHGNDDKAAIFGNFAGKVTENSGTTATGTVTVIDLDHDQSHTQTATNAASTKGYGTFSVDADGHWSYKLDDTNPTVNALPQGNKLTDSFTVTSLDGSNSKTITITITGANDGASITGDKTGGVTEDLAGSVGGTVTVTDVDTGQAHTKIATNAASDHGYGTWSVDANGHWSYALDNGNPAVNALPEGGKLTDSFTVKSLDGTASEVITITITGHNDAPVLTNIASGYFDEDFGGAVFNLPAIGALTITDPDSSSFTYKIDGKAPDGITIDADGTLHVSPAGHYDYLAAGETLLVDVKIKASDGLADSNTVTLPITITGFNDQATISGNNTGSVTEDSGVAATGKLTVADLDHDQAHTQVATDIPAAYGTWSVDTDGQWTYKLDNTNPAVNALGTNGKLFDSFIVTSLDGSDSRVVTVTINGHNDAPVLSTVISAISTYEDVSGGTLFFPSLSTATDPDSPVLTYSLDGVAPAGVSIDANGTLHLDPAGHYDYLADGAIEALQVKIKVSDGEAFSNVVTVPLYVFGQNDKPVIDSNGGGDKATLSVAENTTAVTTVHATDLDATDVVSYSISGGADASLFSIDGKTGLLSFKNAPDFENPADSGKDNVYDVTVKADDSHGGTDTQAIAVTVTNVVETVPTKAADDYIFTTESNAFWVPDAWLLQNDTGNPHSALKIDSYDVGSNSGYFEPVFLVVPTPTELFGNTWINLDTTNDFGDKSYLKNNDHTTFDYTASVGGSSDTATVQATYVVGTNIDRTGDNHDVIIVGSDANEQLTGGNGNDFIRGGGGDDRIFGGNCIDSIYGEDGNDVMRYSTGDNIHGGNDTVDLRNDLSGTADDRGDVLAFGQSINLIQPEFNGQFDGIETVSLKNGEAGGSGAQALTINASNVNAMSDHTITPGGVFSEHAAVRIDMDAVDQLYLSISKDGGKWSNTGQTADGAYDIFVHDATAGTAGNSENAYVMVAHANVGNVHLNQDAPTT